MYDVYAMSTVCKPRDGYGLIIFVKGGDHNPPHAHITDLDNKLLGKMIITNEIPSNTNQLFKVKGSTSSLSTKQKQQIIEWANQQSKNKKFVTYKNWEVLQGAWGLENDEQDIFPSVNDLTLTL